VKALVVLAMLGCAHHPPVEADESCRRTAPVISLGDAGSVATLLDKTVVDVHVVGASPALSATLEKLIETKPGDNLAAPVIRDDIHRLWALGVLTDVRVDAVLGLHGASLTFQVTPELLIDHVEITGDARALPEMRRLRALEGTPYNAGGVARTAAAIEQSLIYNGYLDAKLRVAGAGSGVCVHAKRGPLVTIRNLKFDGNRLLADEVLLNELRGNKTINRPGGIFDEQVMADDRVKIEALYYDRGKAEIRVGAPTFERHANTIDITIPVKEGATYMLGKIAVAAVGGHAERLPIKRGQAFSRSLMRDAIDQLEARSHSDVYPQTVFDEDTHTIAVNMTLTWRHAWDLVSLLPRH
jgi:outer membrane protein assembly factor BamA